MSNLKSRKTQRDFPFSPVSFNLKDLLFWQKARYEIIREKD